MDIKELLENELRFGAASAKREVDEITKNVNELDDLVTEFGKTNNVSERAVLVDKIAEITTRIGYVSAQVYIETDKSNDNATCLIRAANNCRCIKD